MKHAGSSSRALRLGPTAVAAGDRAGYFSSGTDSPVSIAWLTKRSFADSSRTSAGTMSPADKYTMSPGTRSAIGISRGRGMQARSTAVVELTIALSSSAARLERNSCQKRSSVLKSTIELKTMIVLNERSSAAAKITSEKSETMLTANSTPLNGVRKAWKSCWYHVAGLSWVTSLEPYRSRRASTCSSVRPLRALSSARSVSSGAREHSRAKGDEWDCLLRPILRSWRRCMVATFMARASYGSVQRRQGANKRSGYRPPAHEPELQD